MTDAKKHAAVAVGIVAATVVYCVAEPSTVTALLFAVACLLASTAIAFGLWVLDAADRRRRREPPRPLSPMSRAAGFRYVRVIERVDGWQATATGVHGTITGEHFDLYWRDRKLRRA